MANMKNTGRITGMMLMLFIAGSLSLSAQRGMRGVRPDSAEMRWMRMKQLQMPLMMQNSDSLKMGGMGYGMNRGRMNNMGRFMGPMWQMRQPAHGMGHMWMVPGMRMMTPRMGRGSMGPGMGRPGMGMRQGFPGGIMGNVPNLTDKQKKDIAALKIKQQDEMQKLREEMQAKVKALRESQRTKVMNLLTDEQKKWFEENTPKPLSK
jgi:hypothetical protein